MEFTNEKFMEISQTIKAYQGQKTKYNDLVAKYQELEVRSKRQELMHRNELADLNASIHDQIEDKLEQCQAKHQQDLNVLKADIIKAKMETEEIVAEKNSRIAQIEKQLVDARAELDKMACQENRIKELEQGLQVKTFLILSKDREVERLRQRIDEKTELNNRLKSTAMMFEK